MFSTLFTPLVLVLGLAIQVSAHAAIAPALGVKGAPVRADVQRPSTSSECGTVNVASNIDSSQASVIAANGTFATSVTDFNPGTDGSREIAKLLIDPTGTGKSFTVQGKVTQNGDGNPTTTGTQQILATMPAGTQCTGGKTGDLCLASFATTAGFGNCVVLRQATSSGSSAAAANNTTEAAVTTSKSKGKTHKKNKNQKRVAGPRVARLMRDAELWGYELH